MVRPKRFSRTGSTDTRIWRARVPNCVDTRNALRREQFGHDVVIDDAGKFRLVIAVAGNRQCHDRSASSSALTTVTCSTRSGSSRVTRLTASRTSDAAVSRSVPAVEFDADARIVLLAGGVDLPHPGNAGHRVFQNAGDLGIHRFRRGTGQTGADRDDRPVDIGQLAHLDARSARRSRRSRSAGSAPRSAAAA